MTAIRLELAKHPVGFFLAFWLTEAAYLVLALVAMLSLVRPLAEVVHKWPSRPVFPLLLALMLLVGISLWVGLLHPINTAALGRFVSPIYVFVPLMCMVEVALLIFAVALARRYAIEWTRYEAGILVGFGLLAFLTLFARLPGLLALFHFKVGPQLEALFRFFPVGVFISIAIAWLIVFWRPEDPPNQEPLDVEKLRTLAALIRQQTELLKQLANRLGI